MFRIIFLGTTMLYIGLSSLFVQTSHTIAGERHLFGYNTVGIVLGFGYSIIPLASAWYLGRVKRDWWGVAIMLLAIPILGGFVMPQLFLERTEVTPTQIIHRREPPHTRFNLNIAFDEIVSGVELQHENGKRGYRLMLKDGKVVELPANTVLTAAAPTVSAQLQAHHIPLTTETVRPTE